MEKLHKRRIFNRWDVPAALHFPMNKVGADSGGGGQLSRGKGWNSKENGFKGKGCHSAFYLQKNEYFPRNKLEYFSEFVKQKFLCTLISCPGSRPFFPLLSHKM